MDIFKTLQQLSETPGPSGYEEEIRSVVTKLWQPYVQTIHSDRVGSLTALKEGQGTDPRPRILLAAHMDEIGLMVKQIVEYNDYGFLRITPVGGVDRRHLYGQMVTVHGQRPLKGIIGNLPERMLPRTKRNKPFDYETLLIDVGLPLEEVEALVSVGDFVSFQQPIRKLSSQITTGKALDNRASITAVTYCLDYLQNRHHIWDVLAIATCQEETALLGAFTSAYAQRPDIAIAIDVTFGKGPGASGAGIFSLGDGPAIGLGPNVHPGMYEAINKTAQTLEMKVHPEPHYRASGTDAFGLQIARDGIPTGIISIPLRYMHTMVETVHLKDIERTGRLLGEFITQLDDTFMAELAKTMLGKDEQ